jgi:hypothetical protein
VPLLAQVYEEVRRRLRLLMSQNKGFFRAADSKIASAVLWHLLFLYDG